MYDKIVHMKVKLYPFFNHWTNPVWLYSDPHFEDEDCKLMDSNWPDPLMQVKMINSKVGRLDTIVILGDIGNPRYLKDIRGHKVLVLGNHDKGSSNYSAYVDEIYEGPLFISPKILLSHEPIDIPFGINIHGHNHSGEIINRQNDDSFDYNVCSNVINYTPVRLDEVFTLAKTSDIHRITIDKIK